MKHEFKAKVFDFEAGQNVIVINEERALELDIGKLDRVRLSVNGKEAVAIVDFSHSFRNDEIGLFDEIGKKLGVIGGERMLLQLSARPQSLDFIRNKLDGKILSDNEVKQVIRDLMEEKLSNAELASFITAIYCNGFNAEETVSLTEAIYESGGTLKGLKSPVASTHSIGGVAGDRVSMLVVPIIASLGITIPKTCTRAISSASGTADSMEVLTNVTLSIDEVKRVVEETNGCLVWGGAVNIAAADDKLINIRNPLRLDPTSLLLSSILAKKEAEGAEFVLLDIPTGRGSKVEEEEDAKKLSHEFEVLGAHLGMKIHTIITDGSQPLLPTIGPALEAKAVLDALCCRRHGLLVEKACLECGSLLHLVKGVDVEEGYRIALHQITSGKAYTKFKEIIKAQGGNPNTQPEDIKLGKYAAKILAKESGLVDHIDNRITSRICRALGSPVDKKAGIELKVSVGMKVEEGQELYCMYSNSQSKLESSIHQASELSLVEVKKSILG